MSRTSSGQIAAFCFLLMVVIVLISTAGCAAPTPLPQPTPQVVRVEVPGPQPTPQVIEKTVTVSVTPAVCVEALNGLNAALQAENDMLQRYSNGKKPTDAQWQAFMALDPDTIYAAARQCLASTDVGS